MTPLFLSSEPIKAEARRLGFSACGLAPAEPLPADYADVLRRWLDEGCHAGMAYMENHLTLRLDPRRLVEGARTVVSVALNYFTGQELSPRGYAFARYAHGRDYHEVMRRKLRELLFAIGLEEHRHGRVFCDTAPVAERYWAVRCGLGWTGHNGQLIIPGAGSYFFLGELILTQPADCYDLPQRARCGICRRCVEACPAQALSGGGKVDARRCLSCLTIEHRGALPAGTGALMGRCVYGCDRCAEVCPWNRFASPTSVTDFFSSDALRQMTAEDWQVLDVEQYRRLFKGSAVKRVKFEGLVRNISALSGKKNG